MTPMYRESNRARKGPANAIPATIFWAFAPPQFGNNLETISAEHRQKRTRIVQGKQRRINKIDNPNYLDTLEVIGSIPVAPIAVSSFTTITY